MTQVSIANPCLPVPDPCITELHDLFNTPISIRRAGLCEGPYCDCIQPGYGRARITSHGTLDRSRWIEGWIWSQLATRGEISCDEHVLRKRAGGWWADAYRNPANSFRSGAKLWALQWQFVTNEALMMAKAYAQQALSPLMLWGIASRIVVEVKYISQKVMQLHIKITGPGVQVQTTIQGVAMPNSVWLWKEYDEPPLKAELSRIGPRRLGE
jgi:phage gp46-like protein